MEISKIILIVITHAATKVIMIVMRKKNDKLKKAKMINICKQVRINRMRWKEIVLK